MADEESGGESSGGGKKKMIIIIVAVVLLLVIGIVVFLMMSGGEEEELPEEEIPVTGAAEPLMEPIFLPLESFVVNLKDGRRFLKTTIQLMLSEPGAAAYLTIRLVEVKDIVLTELQELSVEDVKQSDAREALRQRLISSISRIFPSKPEWEDPEPIRKVLFEEFVIQ
ncbi:MAG: flagellar basal body-associated FliL family protein [SAR324 cluster bacterium]|nr:flagellar basal body-associated FliL family protein [SAR324 cluster bacterium]MBL7034673.1 flagellar basal body-associated FliL family protein [SAR324 cluster bacterium]